VRTSARRSEQDVKQAFTDSHALLLGALLDLLSRVLAALP